MTPPRLLFHVQSLLGIGHHRRAEALAAAAAEAGFTVTVACGGPPLPDENWGRARRVQLPAARAAAGALSTLLDAGSGEPVDESWKARRREALLALAKTVEPDILLLEGYPFARRQLRFEIDPLIAALKGQARIATSVRDILVEKNNPSRTAEIIDRVRRDIDRVLVHGDPTLVPLDRSFPAAGQIADRLTYTGYVAPPPPRLANPEAAVIVSAGGGAVGASLLAAAAAARRLTPLKDARWLLITGAMMPPETVTALAAELPPGITLARHRSDFRELLAGARLSISQAGYNTVLDLLVCGTPAVLVPFAAPGETEQTRRAELLEQAGRITLCPEDSLTPERLADAITHALSKPPATLSGLRLDGAAETARQLKELLP
jgi:predicted glycosyltransferase